ncbi:MAG: AAA family ATPase [Candidatus Njordarchaeia archaeon]
MVVLKSLSARNFRKLNIDMHFPNGVLIIRGPNESGKSTILEAILFALFGRLMRGVKDLVINYRSNQATVELIFSVNNKDYAVKRVIRRNGATEAHLFELLPNGMRESIANTTKRVNAEIEKLLGGLTFNELLVTNVVAQKDLERIIQSRQDREKVVNALIGLDSYNKAIEKIKKERSQKRKELELKEKTFEQIQRRLSEYHSAIAELERKHKELNEKEKALPLIEEELTKVGASLNVMKQYKNVLDKYRELEAKKKNIVDKISEIKENTKYLEKKIIERNQENKQLSEELSKLTAKLKEIENELANYKNMEQARAFLQKLEKTYQEYLPVEVEIKNLTSRADHIEKRLKEINIELDKYNLEEVKKKEEILIKMRNERKLKIPMILTGFLIILAGAALSRINLTIGGTAIFIGILILGFTLFEFKKQFYGVDKQLLELDRKYRDLKLKIKEKEDLEKELSNTKSRLLNLKNQEKILIESLQKEMRSLDDAYKPQMEGDIHKLYSSVKRKINDAVDKYNSLQNEIKVLKEKIEKVKVLKEKNTKEINELENKILSDKERKTQLEKELEEINSKIQELKFPKLPDGLEFTEDTLGRIESRYRDLQSQRSIILGELKEIRRTIETLEKKIEENKDLGKEFDQIKEDLDNLKLELEALNHSIEILKTVATKIRERFIPYLEQYMSELISFITEGKYKAVRLSKDYNLEVFDSTAGQFISKDIYSGGTVDQFLLAMRLAFILSLIPQTKGIYPKFLFLDEPLASSDNTRRRNIIRLLTNNLRKYFDQIILITHLENIGAPRAKILRIVDGRIIT